MKFCRALFLASLLSQICTWSFGQRLKIGVNVQSPPFCFLSEGEDKDDTVGLEYQLAIGLAKHIARSKRIRYYYPQFINLKSPQMRERLLANDLDYVIDRYSITDKRKETTHFSKHYHVNLIRLAMLIHKGSKVSSIGFLRGSTADDYYSAQKLKGHLQEDITLVSISDQQKLLQQFFERKFDAIVDDREFLEYWNSHTKDFTYINELKNQETDTFAIAISHRNLADVSIVNDFIDSIWTTDPKNGNRIVENLLNADRGRPPIPGIIIYPKQKSYKIIIPVFLGIPVAITIFLIFLGNGKVNKPKQSHNFQISDAPINFAWIIANSKYEYKNGLSGHPYRDAIKLKQALTKYSFPENHIIIQKDVTRKGILKTFHDIASRCSNADLPFSDVIQQKDNLLIYFSGHGEKIQIGQSQIGFWIPVDGASSWEFIPDYELKAMLALIDVKNILLISDSCFSGTLLNIEPESDKGANSTDQCIEIITAGNNRVPAESIFLEKLTDLLSSHPKELLSSSEIYNHLKSELTNYRHYQPQFGSLIKGSKAGHFVFARPLTAKQSEPPEVNMISGQIMNVLSKFSDEKRFIDYTELSAACQMDEKLFSQLIATLTEERMLIIRANSSIFITQNGLNYGK